MRENFAPLSGKPQVKGAAWQRLKKAVEETVSQ
jgi:hypothetical protein